METAINFQKSIAKRRLIYETPVVIADYIVTYIGSGFFIVLAGILLVTKMTVMPFWIFIFVIGFIIWMVLNVILFNTLIKVNGINIIRNRRDIIKVLNEVFNLNIEDKDQLIIREVRLSGFIHWGRVITVLFDNDDVYINIQSLGRADALSFFHGFTNYLKSKRIAKRFVVLQNGQ